MSRGERGLRRALVVSSAGTTLTRVAGATGGLLAARLLGPAGRGEFAVLMVLATGLSFLLAAGVQFWVTVTASRTGGVGAAAGTVATHCAAIVTTTVAVAVVAVPLLARSTSFGATALVAAFAYTATNALQLVVLALAQGRRAMGVFSVATITGACTYLATVAVLLATGPASVALVLLGGAAGNVLSIVIVIGWASRTDPGDQPAARGRNAYAGAVRFGLPAGLSELVLLAMLRVDVLVVAAFLPLRLVGLYAVATALTEVLWVLPDGVSLVVLPTSAAARATSPTPRWLRRTAGATAVGAAALVAGAHLLVTTAFGARFGGATAAVPYLAAASVAGGIWKVAAAEVVGLGRPAARLASALVGVAVMVAVDVVCVPRFGIAGAGAGSLLGYTAAAGLVARAWRSARRDASPDRPATAPVVAARVPVAVGSAGAS